MPSFFAAWLRLLSSTVSHTCWCCLYEASFHFHLHSLFQPWITGLATIHSSPLRAVCPCHHGAYPKVKTSHPYTIWQRRWTLVGAWKVFFARMITKTKDGLCFTHEKPSLGFSDTKRLAQSRTTQWRRLEVELEFPASWSGVFPSLRVCCLSIWHEHSNKHLLEPIQEAASMVDNWASTPDTNEAVLGWADFPCPLVVLWEFPESWFIWVFFAKWTFSLCQPWNTVAWITGRNRCRQWVMQCLSQLKIYLIHSSVLGKMLSCVPRDQHYRIQGTHCKIGTK